MLVCSELIENQIRGKVRSNQKLDYKLGRGDTMMSQDIETVTLFCVFFFPVVICLSICDLQI